MIYLIYLVDAALNSIVLMIADSFSDFVGFGCGLCSVLFWCDWGNDEDDTMSSGVASSWFVSSTTPSSSSSSCCFFFLLNCLVLIELYVLLAVLLGVFGGDDATSEEGKQDNDVRGEDSDDDGSDDDGSDDGDSDSDEEEEDKDNDALESEDSNEENDDIFLRSLDVYVLLLLSSLHSMWRNLFTGLF